MHDDKDPVGTNVEALTPPVPVNPLPDATKQRDESVPSPDLFDLRLQRISDYLSAALSSPMAEVAVLGGINADLATIELRLSESIQAILTACKSADEYVDAVPEGVEMMLKVSRQIERGTRLANELARSQGKR